MKKHVLYTTVECAVFIALSVALSFIKIPVAAFGGSVDFVMVPLFVICYRHGVKYGVMSGAVFGLLKCIIGGGIGWGLPSVLLDYVLAYGAVGVAGIFSGRKKLLEISVLAGCIARFAIHFISGVTLYAITVPTETAGMLISNAWLYSLIYNATYMLPNTIVAVVVIALLHVPLTKIKRIK